jgi:DNA-binding protein HU-beta
MRAGQTLSGDLLRLICFHFLLAFAGCNKINYCFSVMTKPQLQSALAEAAGTSRVTAGVFLDTLSAIASKETKKTGEFVLPGIGKLVKQRRNARVGFNPKTMQKIKIPAKTVVKFRVAKVVKDAVLGIKK